MKAGSAAHQGNGASKAEGANVSQKGIGVSGLPANNRRSCVLVHSPSCRLLMASAISDRLRSLGSVG